MPIEIQKTIHIVDKAAFKSVDYEVMGLAYRIHRELGRLFDEQVYSAALAEQLNEVGFEACREVPIKLTHGDFEKTYWIDILVNSSIPYELKAVDCFHRSHDAQLLQYLFLTNLKHGKLLNFGSRSAEGRFIDSQISEAERKEFNIITSEKDSHNYIEQIVATLEPLLEDWGAYLTMELYREALVALLPTAESSSYPASHKGREIGNITLTTLDGAAILHVSSLKDNSDEMRSHINRTLKLTEFEHSYWVNFNRSRITIERITLD